MSGPDGLLGFVREALLLHGQLAPVVMVSLWIAVAIDLLGSVILVIAAAGFLAGCARSEASRDEVRGMRRVKAERVEPGRYVLAGLEILIVSEIIHTALGLAMADMIFLGVLVIIRSFISFLLVRELPDVKEEMTYG